PDLAPEILRPRPSRVGQAEHRRREIGPLGVSGGSEEESCERQSYRQRLRGSEAFHVINRGWPSRPDGGKNKLAATSATLRAMANEGPKSSYELAMERLRQKDKEASVDDRPLTEEQKAAIADARQFHTAKVAELDILHQAALAGAASHEEIQRLNDNL